MQGPGLRASVSCLFVFLLIPCLAFANSASVPSAALDAFVNQDGSVSLSYDIEISNPEGSDPLTSFTVSLPSSDFAVDQIHAFRCDPKTGMQTEQDGKMQAEQEGREQFPVAVSKHPDPQMDTEIVLDLKEQPIEPGTSGSICVNAPIRNNVSQDLHCPNYAYVTIRPTLYYGKKNELSDLTLNIHLPDGISASHVLAQQEWPREQMQYSVPVSAEDGHAVVHWNEKKPLNEIYWVAAIFPAGKTKLKKAYDGLQTEARIVPKETLELDAYVQEDGNERLIYALDIDNAGSCKSVDTIQFVLPGKPQSLSGSVNGKMVNVSPSNTVNDNLRLYMGNSWYRPYNANLGANKIAPGDKGTIRIETVVRNEVKLFDTKQSRLSVELNTIASASGYWRTDSSWTTRIHMPAGVSISDVDPSEMKVAEKETEEGHTVIQWKQTKSPAPVSVSFPMGNFKNIDWAGNDIDQWKFALLHYQRFPQLGSIVGRGAIFLSPILLMIFIGIVRRILFRR
ncbi:MAG: hypothetical protein C5B54_03960 [Acidobacteria bacterium]|nr:MAG: hypothetical protein C5B54_03960 [Acidobacteriota bacterium]